MHITLLILLGFLLSGSFSMVIIPRILVISHKKKLYDVPDERKIHTYPIPRLGGFSFYPSVQMSFLLCLAISLTMNYNPLHEAEVVYQFLFLFVGVTLLFMVGLCDDLVGVGYTNKFLVQVFSALLIVLSGDCLTSLGGIFAIYSISPIVGIPLTVFVMVFLTNAINLIDGIDGLSSSLCGLATAVLAYIFYVQEDYVYSLLALCTLGTLVPFWIYNVFGSAKNGKKLFMGDTGSLTLGYLISFLLIHLCVSNQKIDYSNNPYIVIGFSTVLVPSLDVIRVVILRIRSKNNPFLPDKNHIHHKLLRAGMSVRMAMLSIFVIAVFFILLDVFLVTLDVNLTYILVADVILWTAGHLMLDTIINVKKDEPLH